MLTPDDHTIINSIIPDMIVNATNSPQTGSLGFSLGGATHLADLKTCAAITRYNNASVIPGWTIKTREDEVWLACIKAAKKLDARIHGTQAHEIGPIAQELRNTATMGAFSALSSADTVVAHQISASFWTWLRLRWRGSTSSRAAWASLRRLACSSGCSTASGATTWLVAGHRSFSTACATSSDPQRSTTTRSRTRTTSDSTPQQRTLSEPTPMATGAPTTTPTAVALRTHGHGVSQIKRVRSIHS